MLHLYPSNKTESLAYLISEIITRQPLSGIFDEDIVLIQSQGMGTWLQQELSTHGGVSALLQCQMPASFIWRLAETIMPDDRHIPLFEKNNARWEIFKHLPSKLEDPKYTLLKQYVMGQQKALSEREQGSAQQKILFELSSVLADVFDAYQNYRPDWIESWEQGDSIMESSQADLNVLEQWQSDLWCSLYPELMLEERRHRSRLFASLIDILQAPSSDVKKKLPERLFIFGLSALPPQWLPVMSALSQHVDIHFFVHNPCQYYWGDVLTPMQQLKLEKALVDKGVSLETAANVFLEGNPLLASWGKLGRDYLSLLSDSADIKETQVSLFDEVMDASREEGEYTALKCIQQDILTLQTQQYSFNKTDDSIRFASCHSYLREVEALHDYLFNLLALHPEIQAKDIIVMMPDVQDFAALIEAVFSRPAKDKQGQYQYLPYGISDQLLSMDQPLLETLSGLLSLSSARITGAEVLDWLEMPAIRSRFLISEDEMDDIKDWVNALNIRWGLSETHRDKILSIQNSGVANTWLHAAQRLLAGYIYGQEDIYTHAGEAVLAFPQRSPEKQLLAGKLIRLLDTIEASITLQSKQFTLEEWLGELSKLWQSWLDFEFVPQDIQMILASIEADITKEQAHTNFDESLSFSVIASVLTSHFENQRVSQRFLAGRINFCTLMPMRSIPFKVVCMLGLNEGAYPRPIHGQSFDLLTHMPVRTGDRSRREDDRYLFLEALSSARSHVYISYCGRNIQDNSERYPSILVTELQSYCAENFTLNDHVFEEGETILDHYVCEHHLQPFHKDYYASQDLSSVNQTFASEWLPLLNAQKLYDTSAIESESRCAQTSLKTEHVSIDFDRLLQCAGHPLRYYYQTVLQLTIQGLDESISETEPFSIRGLSAYELKTNLAQHWFDEQGSSTLITRWALEGKLPRPPLDTYYTDEVQESLSTLYHYIGQNISTESERHEFELNIDSFRVSGSLITQGAQLVDMVLSKSVGASFFSFWIKHVFWSLYCARNNTLQVTNSLLISPETEISIPILPEEQAEAFALACCQFFEQASLSPHVFFAKSTYALIFQSESKMREAFWSKSNVPGESDDVYWKRYCLMSNALAQQDWQALPDITQSCFFQQVESIKETITIQNLPVNAPSDISHYSDKGVS